MPCYTPLKAYRSPKLSESGKLSISFSPVQGYSDVPIELSCGQCIGCRLERSRQWAVRATHEAQLHDENCFLTLTYSDEHLPYPPSISVSEMQRFFKRFRKLISPRKIRYIYCGEYGDENGRPHYHAIIFGYDFSASRTWYSRTNRGDFLYTSSELSTLWPFGHAIIGDVTFQSAAYVARYSLKKITGDPAADHYQWIDPETGEIHQLTPEFFNMSRRPGIGMPWLEKYRTDVYPSDEVILDGRKIRPPTAYDKKLTDEEALVIKSKRILRAKKHAANNTPARRKVRQAITTATIRERVGRKL